MEQEQDNRCLLTRGAYYSEGLFSHSLPEASHMLQRMMSALPVIVYQTTQERVLSEDINKSECHVLEN